MKLKLPGNIHIWNYVLNTTRVLTNSMQRCKRSCAYKTEMTDDRMGKNVISWGFYIEMICQFKSKHYIMFKQHIKKNILLTCSWNTFIPSYWKIACLYFGKFREITDYLFPQLKSNCTTNSHDCEPINFFKFWLFYYFIMTWKNRIFKIDRKKIEHIGIPFLCMYMYI